MKCPICPAEDIPDDSVECPVCKSDLTSLQRARQLHVAEYNEAVRLTEIGATDGALRHASASVALCSTFVPGLVLCGKLLRQKGARRAAMAAWEEAAQIAPDNDEIQTLIAAGRAATRRHRALRVLGGCMVGIIFGLLVGMPWFLALRALQGQEDRITRTAERATEQSVAALAQAVDAEPEGAFVPQPAIAEEERLIIGELQTLLDEIREIHVQATEPTVQEALVEDMETLNLEIQAIADAIRELQFSADTTEMQQRRLFHSMGAVISLLRPADMQVLKDDLLEAQTEVTSLTQEKGALEGRKDIVAVVRRRRYSRRLRDSHARLAELTTEWRGRIEPWRQAKRAFRNDGGEVEPFEAEGGEEAVGTNP